MIKIYLGYYEFDIVNLLIYYCFFFTLFSFSYIQINQNMQVQVKNDTNNLQTK
jgi:hypothetical protein